MTLFKIFSYRGESFKNKYFITYLKYLDPKFAITFIHNSTHLCDIVQKAGNCKLAFVQNGIGSTNVYWGKKENSFKCDYYFANCNNWVEYSKKYLKAKYIVSGSIIGNNFPLSKHKKVKKIQWISQWRDYPETIFLNGKTRLTKDFIYKPAKISMDVISDFCKKNDLYIEIIGSRDVEKESAFYSKLLDDFDFLGKDIQSTPYKSYEEISNNAIICGNNSMLLYESFARKYRTAFFAIGGYYVNDLSTQFNWPNATDDFGDFWCNVPDKNHMENNLKYLFHVDQGEWCRQVNKYENVQKYNSGNSIIRQTLKDEGVYIND